MNQNPKKKTGVVLAGHGVPATDCPPQWVGELMALQFGGTGHGHAHGAPLSGRAAELDAKIRNWPRRADNDPYKEGLERLAAVLRPLLGDALFIIGYNEFCGPTVPEAIEEMIRQGASRVLVIPSMLTPGGLHSEKDIPRSIQQVQALHPAVSIEYLWPFDLTEIASLLARHIQRKKP